MEIWWIGPDQSLQGSFWLDGNPAWTQYQLEPRNWASASGGIAAVSPGPNYMIVWYIGSDASVQEADFTGSWNHGQIAPAGSALSNSGITAVSRASPTLELWWVGSDGSVQDAYWYDNAFTLNFESGWQRFALSGPASAKTSSRISSVSRYPNSMELWWVGPGGSVQDENWYGPYSTAGVSLCASAALGHAPPCIWTISFDSADGRNAGTHWVNQAVSTDQGVVNYTEFNMRYGREADDHSKWQQFNYGSDVHDVGIHNLQPSTLYGVIVEGKVGGLVWTPWSSEIQFETWPQ
jgi:hypothetical protein